MDIIFHSNVYPFTEDDSETVSKFCRKKWYDQLVICTQAQNGVMVAYLLHDYHFRSCNMSPHHLTQSLKFHHWCFIPLGGAK